MEVLRLTTIFLRPSIPLMDGNLQVALYEGERPQPGQGDSPLYQSPGPMPFNPGGQRFDIPLPEASLDQLWFMVWGQVRPANPPVCVFNGKPSQGTAAIVPANVQDAPSLISLASITMGNGISGRLEVVNNSQPLHGEDGYPPNEVGFWAMDLVDVAAAPTAPSGLSAC